MAATLRLNASGLTPAPAIQQAVPLANSSAAPTAPLLTVPVLAPATGPPSSGG